MRVLSVSVILVQMYTNKTAYLIEIRNDLGVVFLPVPLSMFISQERYLLLSPSFPIPAISNRNQFSKNLFSTLAARIHKMSLLSLIFKCWKLATPATKKHIKTRRKGDQEEGAYWMRIHSRLRMCHEFAGTIFRHLHKSYTPDSPHWHY